MRIPNIQFRACVSVLVAIAVATGFTLKSLADESSSLRPRRYGLTQQGLTGLLKTRGDVTVNGNTATTGATVVSGNSIATGSNGYATIELGPLGYIELKTNTAIKATLSPGSVPLVLDRCGSITQTLPPGVAGLLTDPYHDRAHVKVISGQVHVKYNGKEQDLKSGESKTFDSLEEVSTPGGTTFRVSCGEHHEAVLILPLGLLGLAGLAYGLVQQSAGPAVSPARP